MAFWSDKTLKNRVCELITPYDEKRIEQASYALSLGANAFVTTESDQSVTVTPDLFTNLSEKNRILQIYPGQLGFLMTEEVIKVPEDAIALISMKTKYKFKGLINVSGFHVDPGFQGKLIFSVYNAGPSPVYLEYKEQIFFIMYAKLDENIEKPYSGKSQNQEKIKGDLVAGLTSDVFSPQTLKRKLERVNKNIAKLVNYGRVAGAVVSAFATILALTAALLIFFPSIPGAVLFKSLEAAGYHAISTEKYDELKKLIEESQKTPEGQQIPIAIKPEFNIEVQGNTP